MIRAKVGVGGFVLLACLLALPSAVLAQSSIAGVVKDSSGGVLPGVTIEAASPVLIEGSKTATTDGAGQYRIIDLRPGIYTITFTLPGFASIRHEKVELPPEFSYSANAEMKISILQETVTVTGVNMFVDVQSAARVQSLSKDIIDNVPTSRTIQTMGQLIVGVTISGGSPDVGGANATEQSYMTVRGIPPAQNTVMVDGLVVSGLENNGQMQNYFNDAASDQIVYQTSDTTASNAGGGVQVNMIARSGGNRFSGDSQLAYRPGELVPDNLGRHRATGITNPPGSKFISDLTVAQGGPIVRDKLWFFTTGRDNRVNNYVLDTYFDDGSRGYDDNYVRDLLGRLTWQVNSSSKLQGYFDKVWKFKGHEMGALTDPETASGRRHTPNYSTGSLKYTWTASNRLFIEGGYSFNYETRTTVSNGGHFERQMDDLSRQLASDYQTNDWYSHVRKTGGGASQGSTTSSLAMQWPIRTAYQASTTYVTGSHTIKGGFGWEKGNFYHLTESHGDISSQGYQSVIQDPVTHNYTFVTQPCAASLLATFPSCRGALTATIANTPRESQESMRANTSLYAQDQWTFKKLTLNAGVRWEWINSQVDASTSIAGRWVPARQQPEVKDRPDWKDWAPRFSVVYDVFGTGKTALKYSVNRYNAAQTTDVAEGYNILSPSTSSRQWTDLNGDNIPQGQRTWNAEGTAYTDCVYQTPGCEIYLSGPAGLSPTTGLAQTLTALPANFGIPGSVPVYAGLPRQYRIEHGVEVQHQIFPRLGATFAWSHWDRYNNTSAINVFRQAWDIDYTTVQFYHPITGAPLPFLYYNITPEAQARQSAAGAETDVLDPAVKLYYDSFQTEFQARPWKGAHIGGGITLEKQRSTNCQTSVPGAIVNPNNVRYCDGTDLLGDGSGVTSPFLKHFKLNFSFPVMWGFTMSGAYQNLDEGAFNRTFNYGRVTQRYPDGSAAFKDASGNIAPAVGCPAGQAVCPVPGAIAGPSTLTSAADITLPIATPGLSRDERLSTLDIKLSRNFRVGRYTMAPTFEVFNLFNGDTILTRSSLAYMNTSGTYLRPSNILKPRLYGFGYLVKW